MAGPSRINDTVAVGKRRGRAASESSMTHGHSVSRPVSLGLQIPNGIMGSKSRSEYKG
jgi:hypothetical protein